MYGIIIELSDLMKSECPTSPKKIDHKNKMKLASFPGPTQLYFTCSMKSGRGPGVCRERAWHLPSHTTDLYLQSRVSIAESALNLLPHLHGFPLRDLTLFTVGGGGVRCGGCVWEVCVGGVRCVWEVWRE